MKTKRESTAQRLARAKQLRRALKQDAIETGCEPDLDDEQIALLEWLNDYEEAREAQAEEVWDEKRHGL